MSPPQLTADTPVFDVLHPVTIGILIFGRIEFQFVIHYRRQCHIGKMLHLEEPLHRKFRLDHNISTFRITYFVGISLRLFEQSGSIEIFLYLLADIKTIHTDIQAGSFAQCSVIIENIDARQIVLFTQHIVVHIVGRSYLQTTGTEFDIHIIIFNNRNHTVYQWHNHLLTFQPGIFRIVRIDTHSRITHNRFRTSGSHHGITSFRITFYFITQVIKFSMFFFIDYLFVRKSSQCFRIPVHHAHTAIDKSFIIKIDKYFQHTFTTLLIHSESSAIPIAGSSQFTKLFQDNSSVFIRPCPGMFQKLITGQIRLFNTFRSKFIYDFRFRCNRSMVRSRHPASIFAFHTGTTNQNILNGIIKHVSHV